MRVVIHKEGFAMEAFTFFIEIFVKTKREFFSVFKLRKWKRIMLKLEESKRWRRWKNSKNGESDYVQMIIYKEVKRMI